MNSKTNTLCSLFLAIAAIIVISLPCRAGVNSIPAAGYYTTLPSPVTIQQPVTDIPMIAAVSIPFRDQFSFTIDSVDRMNHSWYVDNYYLYLQCKSTNDVGHPVAGILFKASRIGLPETITSAVVRLVLARPLASNTAPLLKFYRVKPSFSWSSKSFSDQACQDPAGNCYNSPADLIDFTNPLVVTGKIQHEKKLNDRSVLYADISKGFSEHGFSAADGIFMELQNDIGGDGSFGVASFFGKDAPSPALEASLIYFYDPRTQPASPTTLAANTCGDGICDPMESCSTDCNVSSDITPPGLSFTISPDLQQMDTGTHIVATAIRTGESENNNTSNNNISYPVISAPVYDATALVDLPGLGTEINPDLFDSSKPIAPVSIWVAGFPTTPWNRLLRGTDNDSCIYESSPAPGAYKLCARTCDNAGNLSPTLCKEFRIGSGTPPEISVSVSPADLRLGETLHVQVSVAEHHEGLSSATVNLPDNTYSFPLAGDTTWSQDFDIPLCSWSADQPGRLNPINISVSAIDGEGMSTAYGSTVNPLFPLQARYGLSVKNFGADLCWDQYATTFGNEVYASVSVCAFPPFIFPGKCWDNAVCKCYSGTPDSSISSIVDALGGWIMEAIVDAIDKDDKLEDYFCVQDLSQLGVPDLFALLFFPIYQIAGGPGQCTGFTTAAAMMANHAATPEQICPGCGDKISSWTKDDISFYVGHRQGSVVSSEFIHLLLANYADSVDTVVRKIYDSLLRGQHPGISIIGYPEDTTDCTPTGHTLLIDRVRNQGNGIYRAYVYDSNRPYISGDAETLDWSTSYSDYCDMKHSPYINMDTTHDNFSFQLNDPAINGTATYWTRGNGHCNLHVDLGRLGGINSDIPTPDAALLHVPFSLLSRETFTLPLSIEGMITMFVGNATVTVEDSAGNNMGTDDAQHNGIPGAYLFSLPAAQDDQEGTTLILIPADTSFSVHATGKPDEGHFISLLSPTGTSAFVFAQRGAHENFSFTPQENGMKISIGEGSFTGALHLLAKHNIPLKNIAEKVDASLADETVLYTQVYSFTGSFGQQPVSFMIENEGTLTTIASQVQSCKLFALSNKNAAGDDNQHPFSTMFKVASKLINIPVGAHHFTFDLPHLNTAPFLVESVAKLNAAPTAMTAYTVTSPAVAPAAAMQITGSQKTNVAIIPKLLIPAKLQGKTGNFYALLYWVEGNVWFQFTPAGIELLSDNLKPFKTTTSSQTAEFNLLSHGVDLSDFRGTLDIFIGFATENDLSDLAYNYYQVIFK